MIDRAGWQPYPPLGPLLARAFDKSVTVIAARWRLFAATLIVAGTLGALNLGLGFIVVETFAVYWALAAFANAARLENAGFGLGPAAAGGLVATWLTSLIATCAGLVLLVVPGAWIGTKWSLAAVASVVEGNGPVQSLRRSWLLTTGSFWETLAFIMALGFGMAAVAAAGYLALVSIAAAEVGTSPYAAPRGGGLAGALISLGFAAYVEVLAYGLQAHVIAQLYWFRTLETRDLSSRA